MSDDDPIIEYDDDESTNAVNIDRRVVLLALTGFAALAVMLAVLRARTAPSGSVGQVDLGPDADWRVSLEHLAHAFDLRLAGIDARLDELAGETVAVRAAAFSAPSVSLNGDTPVERIPPPVSVGADEPGPPQPAAVSLPPSE